MPLASVLAGLFIALFLFMAFQNISAIFYPLPEGMDPFDPDQKEAFEAYFKAAPIAMFLIVLFGYIIGSFVGGYVSSFLLKTAIPQTALILGSLLTVAGIFNLMAIPHPTWFVVLNLPSYLLFAWLGSKLVQPKTNH